MIIKKTKQYISECSVFIKEMFHSEFVSPIGIIILGITLLFMILTMSYNDIMETIPGAMGFWDSAFDGKFASFYSNGGGAYDIGLYVVFGIWGLPIWILQKLSVLTCTDPGSVIYFKLLLVIFTVIVLKEVYAISELLGFEKKRCQLTVLMLATSLMFILPIFDVCQYDVIPTAFILIGIRKWMLGENKPFILMFAIAMIMKPFSILIFLAVLLVREKRISLIAKGVVGCALFTVICKVIYHFGADGGSSTTNLLDWLYDRLVQATVPIGRTEAALSVVLLIVVYAVIYMERAKEDQITERKYMMFGVFGVMAIFTVIMGINPYWITYAAPFIILALMMSSAYTYLGMLVAVLTDCSLIYYMCISYDWVFGGTTTFSYLLLKNQYEARIDDVRSVYEFLGVRWGLEKFNTTISGIVLGCMIVIGMIAYRGIKEKDTQTQEFEYKTKTIKWYFIMRVCIVALWSLLCLYLMIK